MSLKSALYDLLYMKPCRAYARHFIDDKPADAVLRFLCSLQYWRTYRFWPNFVKPKRFSEKIWSQMLHDRNPLLTVLNDKFRVREYVAAKVGGDYLIPLLWHGEKPDQIPFDLLPSQFVIKATHGCSYNILVQDKANINREKIMLTLAKWLSENYCQDFLIGIEWGYKNIKPNIIIESFIKEKGKYPLDYKFWCFSGRVESISVHFDRFERHSTRAFDRDFEPGGLNFDLPIYSGEYKRPSNYKEMVRVAESLAEEFDFMRVDLYSVENKIYFSELTSYPGGVTHRFEPESFDSFLGEKWKWK